MSVNTISIATKDFVEEYVAEKTDEIVTNSIANEEDIELLIAEVFGDDF